jgi:predicted MPP superfamily phosphohydrolase
MSEEEIRKYVRIANEARPDLIVLTGDFVTWDASSAPAVVNALSGLKAPLGVYGSLGNHDAWAEAEDLLAELFARAGVRILRQERTAIAAGNESFNLMGLDFTNSRIMSAGGWHLSSRKLEGVENLMAPDTANILLSHNPDSFDRAAQLGIDLSLAGHTHGGQLALEFISPEIAPSRIVTPYVAGWFARPGGQLYVNRGIGTIAAPMRVGAPPEITIFELLRA